MDNLIFDWRQNRHGNDKTISVYTAGEERRSSGGGVTLRCLQPTGGKGRSTARAIIIFKD